MTTPDSQAAPLAPISIVPRPARVTVRDGFFTLRPDTVISAGPGTGEIAAPLAEMLASTAGHPLLVNETTGPNTIWLELDAGLDCLGMEGYTLSVRPEDVEIRAAAPAGLYYGCQSLRQLFPPEIYLPRIFWTYTAEKIVWKVPCMEIEDQPRFSWRGLHLDVGRHFFGKHEIERFIDLLAIHKMNVFHWHLTEDQGWRLPVAKYPGLARVASGRKESPMPGDRNRGDGQPYGGLYSRDEIREVVDYARSRFVTIVPEIEMPGHAQAALAAYPELSCTGQPIEVATRWGIFEDVFCAGNDRVFEFLEDVLEEVLDLFPGAFVHVGGDECPKERWKVCPKCQARIAAEGLKDEHELQSYFIRRIETFLNSRGRRLIGWDEILEGGLAPHAAVMSWRGEDGGIAAAAAGHDVVMTPTSYAYFDYYQSEDTAREPEAIGGFLPLEKVYSYDPVPESLPEPARKHILGVQGNIWTEYIRSGAELDYMTFPRACAMAEVGWTPVEQKQYSDFMNRLRVHVQRLEGYGAGYRPLDKPITSA